MIQITAFSLRVPGTHENLCKWIMSVRYRKTDLFTVRRKTGRSTYMSFLLCFFKAEALCGQFPVISQIAHPKSNFLKYTMFWI